MRHRVYGSHKKLTKNEVRHASRWMLREILGEKLADIISLSIIFKDHEPEDRAQAKVAPPAMLPQWGSCEAMQWGRHPSNFKITLQNKKITRVQTLKALAHEMYHVAQYVLGKLVDFKSGKSKWKHAVYSFDDKKEVATCVRSKRELEYFDLPWEKEAYAKMEGLYQRYRVHLKSSLLAFA